METTTITVLLFQLCCVWTGFAHDHSGAGNQCPATSYTFDKGDYVEFLGQIPAMAKVTVCTYVTTNSEGIVNGVVGSYGTEKQKKAIVVLGEKWNGRGLRVIVSGQAKKVPADLDPNTEYHFCLVIDTTTDKVTIHKNGLVTPIPITFKKLKMMPGGGTILVGKAHYDDSLGFEGKIRNLMLWDRLLTPAEIAEVYNHNVCPENPIVSLKPEYVLPHGAFVKTEECLNADFTLDNSGDSVNYIEILTPIPELEYATLCIWVTSNKQGMFPGTAGSYAIGKNVDVLLSEGLKTSMPQPIKLGLNGETKLVFFTPDPFTEYFNCMTIYGRHNKVETYVNGHRLSTLTYDNNEKSVPAGGTFILGQRQGCEGGCFEKDRAFNGKMRNFALWKRILSPEEMTVIVKSNMCPSDHIAQLNPEYLLTHGRLFPHQTCLSSEFNIENGPGVLTYVQYLKSIPAFEYATMCTWVTTDQFGRISGTVGSYVTRDEIDVIVASGEVVNGAAVLKVTVNGQGRLTTKAQFMPKTEYNFCLAFLLPKNQVMTYVNGNLGTVLEFSNLGSAPGGGKLIIGQRQTSYDGGFDSSIAFNGKIRDFMMWKRILSVEEMVALAEENECPKNHVVDLVGENAALASS